MPIVPHPSASLTFRPVRAFSTINMQEATHKVSETSCEILNVPLSHTTPSNADPGLIPVSFGSVWSFESKWNLFAVERPNGLCADASVWPLASRGPVQNGNIMSLRI